MGKKVTSQNIGLIDLALGVVQKPIYGTLVKQQLVSGLGARLVSEAYPYPSD